MNPARARLPGALLLAVALTACGRSEPLRPYVPLGGGTTVRDITVNAFGLPARTLTREERSAFQVGDSFFNRNWVTAPASTRGRDGLGPLFNARSCSGCHFKDGRGRAPVEPGAPMSSMLVRLSVPGKGPHGGPKPEPTYGGQLQDQAILGVPAEGRAIIQYTERPGTFADGTPFSLREPRLEVTELAYGPLADDVRYSPRVAPALIGLGLLEAVPAATVLARADPEDKDADGISGRANRVWDVEAEKHRLGRFGWKANQPSLRQQVAGAFHGDIGITSSIFRTDNFTEVQHAAARAPNGGYPEVASHALGRVVLYMHTLAVPAQRTPEAPDVRRGAVLFREARCDACHLPELTSGSSMVSDALSNQTFRPYTDLLLHDMGSGLADERPDFEATGREWRTPPLWGIGLIETVNRHTELLHDGRARNLTEALLWHAGEAEDSREAFRKMPKADRKALLAFLRSL